MILTEIKNGAKEESFQLKKKYRLSFTVDSETMEKIKLAISLLSNKFPTGMKYEELFVILLNEYLGRHNPEARVKRIGERDSNRDSAGNDPAHDIIKKNNKNGHDTIRKKGRGKQREKDKAPGNSGRNSTGRPNRSIPRKVSDEVFTRDGGRCTFVGDDGMRCNCRHNLQIDHIVFFARGGSNSPDNLRLLCARHNLLEAERVFGRDRMKKFYRGNSGKSNKIKEPAGMYYDIYWHYGTDIYTLDKYG